MLFRSVATDGCARGPRSAATSVTVLVEDTNDNAPVCGRNPVNDWVGGGDAAAAANRTVATVTATDADRGENGTVRFSLVGDSDVFDVGVTSGKIWLKTALGAGFSGAKLQVLAEDQGQVALTSTCLVLIHLKGEEEGLQFTQKDYQATVVENSQIGIKCPIHPHSTCTQSESSAQYLTCSISPII